MYRRVIGYGVAVASLALLPLGVFAQCSMPGTSHGGHEAKHESPGKRKLSKQVRAVLESDERRAELMDALMDDREFMGEIMERIAGDVAWRAMMRQRLSTVPADDPAAPASSLETTSDPEQPAPPTPAAGEGSSASEHMQPGH